MPQTIELNFELHPKQLQAFQCPANEILFGGATRGGKSHFVRIALITFCEAVPGIQCLIIRKYYDDVISNHMEGPTGFKKLLKPLIDAKLVRVTKDEVRWLKTGSLIKLSHCATEEAMQKNQGLGKDVLVFEEACQIEERYIRFIRGWVTTTEDMKAKVPDVLKGHLPKIYYTANPIGRSMGYFRRSFVKAATPGIVFQAPDDDGGFTRAYIEARVEDNPDEDPEATARRIMGLGDIGMSAALLNADWDAPIGDYFPQYDDIKHTIKDFRIPNNWFKFLTFDWGSSEPFAVTWWAVVGEGGYESTNKYLRPGTLVCYREWYGCDKNDPAKGLQLRNEEIAQGIIDRTNENTSGLVITDSLPFQDRGMSSNGKKYTVADVFRDAGVPLVRGNTARVHGWTQLRDRLIGIDGDPLIVFFNSCVHCRDYLPALPRHPKRPEDAEESGEATHICFSGETLVMTPEGSKRIDEIKVGDYVIAGDGIARQATAAGVTQKNAIVVDLDFADGEIVTCTRDHEFLTSEGWVKAFDCAGYACIINTWNQKSLALQSKSLTDAYTSFILGVDILRIAVIGFTLWCGNIILAMLGGVIAYTTSIIIGQITRLPIFEECLAVSTQNFIWRAKSESKSLASRLIRHVRQQLTGIGPKSGESGIENITIKSAESFYIGEKAVPVSIATRSLTDTDYKSIVQTSVSQRFTELKRRIALRLSASIAGVSFLRQQHARRRLALSLMRSSSDGKKLRCNQVIGFKRQDVYCLTEPVTGSFLLANGLVVSNCDAIRYACTTRPLVAPKIQDRTTVIEPVKISPSPKEIMKQLKRVRRN